jgi:hypothetical protein
MRAMSLGDSCFHRMVVVAAATTLAVTALLTAKPYYFGIADSNKTSRVEASKSNPNQASEIGRISFVPSPTIETNPKFFFGTGDGSNGYYAERPGSR